MKIQKCTLNGAILFQEKKSVCVWEGGGVGVVFFFKQAISCKIHFAASTRII